MLKDKPCANSSVNTITEHFLLETAVHQNPAPKKCSLKQTVSYYHKHITNSISLRNRAFQIIKCFYLNMLIFRRQLSDLLKLVTAWGFFKYSNNKERTATGSVKHTDLCDLRVCVCLKMIEETKQDRNVCIFYISREGQVNASDLFVNQSAQPSSQTKACVSAEQHGRGPGQWEIDFLCCIYRNANTLQRVTLWRSGCALSVHHRKPQEKP